MVLRNRDIFSSGTMVEEVTFQAKGVLKGSTINQILIIAERVQLLKRNHIKCFCEGKRKHDTIIPFN